MIGSRTNAAGQRLRLWTNDVLTGYAEVIPETECTITSVCRDYLGLLWSELCRVNTAQSTRAVATPTSLRHQSGILLGSATSVYYAARDKHE
jgi:hypothetical protein